MGLSIPPGGVPWTYADGPPRRDGGGLKLRFATSGDQGMNPETVRGIVAGVPPAQRASILLREMRRRNPAATPQEAETALAAAFQAPASPYQPQTAAYADRLLADRRAAEAEQDATAAAARAERDRMTGRAGGTLPVGSSPYREADAAGAANPYLPSVSASDATEDRRMSQPGSLAVGRGGAGGFEPLSRQQLSGAAGSYAPPHDPAATMRADQPGPLVVGTGGPGGFQPLSRQQMADAATNANAERAARLGLNPALIDPASAPPADMRTPPGVNPALSGSDAGPSLPGLAPGLSVPASPRPQPRPPGDPRDLMASAPPPGSQPPPFNMSDLARLYPDLGALQALARNAGYDQSAQAMGHELAPLAARRMLGMA